MTWFELRVIEVEISIPASVDVVWDAWTTEQGIRSFFAPDCRIDLRPGGVYEMYFDPDATPGLRGGEGCRVLAVDKPHMLSFMWNNPPEIAKLRDENQNTHVTLRFMQADNGNTDLKLIHDGWGTGRDWDHAFAYFERAWREIVLPRLVQRFSPTKDSD